MSIANRDASLQCLNNAREASKRNDLERAIQLCEKSLRLYETDEARTFLAAVKLKKERQGPEKSQRDSDPDQSTTVKQDVRNHEPVRGNYTKEQQETAVAVRNTKCYYARLNIENKCNDIEVIKRAYKKRAFQFHPDKNHAPASADAFKAINQAYECLIDEQRKAAYDRYGTEDLQSINAQSAHSSYTYHAGHEDVVTPEDILNMFFSAGGNRMPQFQRRRGRPSHDAHAQQQRQPAPWFQLLMQFLPVLFLLMFSMWSGPRLEGAGRPGINSGVGEVFTLEKTNGFVIQRSTSDHNLAYFVRPQFTQWYGHDKRALARIEHLVTLAHIQSLKMSCEVEKHNRDAAIEKAKGMIGDNQTAALSKAHAMKLASCDKLSGIYIQ